MFVTCLDPIPLRLLWGPRYPCPPPHCSAGIKEIGGFELLSRIGHGQCNLDWSKPPEGESGRGWMGWEYGGHVHPWSSCLCLSSRCKAAWTWLNRDVCKHTHHVLLYFMNSPEQNRQLGGGMSVEMCSVALSYNATKNLLEYYCWGTFVLLGYLFIYCTSNFCLCYILDANIVIWLSFIHIITLVTGYITTVSHATAGYLELDLTTTIRTIS